MQGRPLKGKIAVSFPNIPDVNADIKITTEDSVNLLLASIAFEELGRTWNSQLHISKGVFSSVAAFDRRDFSIKQVGQSNA